MLPFIALHAINLPHEPLQLSCADQARAGCVYDHGPTRIIASANPKGAEQALEAFGLIRLTTSRAMLC